MPENNDSPTTRLDRFVKPSQINKEIGLSRSTALCLEAAGEMPRRVRVSPGQTAWLASDLAAFMKSRRDNR